MAFSRSVLVDGGKQTITADQYKQLLNMRPIFIPGTVGITVQEEYLRPVSQDRMITEGRQNQVLRNLVYRLKEQPQVWREFTKLITPLFALHGMDVPFNPASDEWLTATYHEGECEFDLVSAGSGFLQTLNLLCFLFLNHSKTALLDEPDSHMHDDLQRVVYGVLDKLSLQKQLQLIIATHSSTLIDSAGLDSVILIDRRKPHPMRPRDVDTLVPLLNDQGLALPPNKVLEVLRVRKALFVEGIEADYESFILEIGEVLSPGFKNRVRGLKVFSTGGRDRRWPLDAIQCFEKLLGVDLAYLYVADRDYLTDDEISDRNARAGKEGLAMDHLERRHRESYLIDSTILSRLLEGRWKKKNGDAAVVPEQLTKDGIQAFIVRCATEWQDIAQAELAATHEPSLRGDENYRKEGLRKLNVYFRLWYSELIAKKEVPLKLLNAKKVLSELRRKLNDEHNLSFSDTDICQAYRREEVPADLKAIIERISSLFPPPSQGSPEQQTLPGMRVQ